MLLKPAEANRRPSQGWRGLGAVVAACGGFSEEKAARLVGWLGKFGAWPRVVLLKPTEGNRRSSEAD